MDEQEYTEPTKEEWDAAIADPEEYHKLAVRQMYSYYADCDRVLARFKPICNQFGYIPEPKDWSVVTDRFKAMSPKDRHLWIIEQGKRLAHLGWIPPRDRVL